MYISQEKLQLTQIVDLLVDLRYDVCAIQEVHMTVMAAYLQFWVVLAKKVPQRPIDNCQEVDRFPDFDL